MMTGLISFSISGIIIGLISLRLNEVLMLILGGFAGFFVGFMIGELLAWIIGLCIPSLRNLELVKAQIVPNIVVLIAADAIYGATHGSLFYGRKSVKFFALVCGIASIPFGILLSMPINIAWINFDQNLLFTLVSFGTTYRAFNWFV